MALSAGSNLGGYEILERIGAGGMGAVYSALDPTLGRRLAIKVLEGERRLDSSSLVRFAKEARSASALNHPNIVTIYEVALESDPPFIAMELVEGTDLRHLMMEGPLSIRKTLQLGTQIAEGLAAAHEKGIVHRDLKPENLMLSRDGFVKILDFGLAKLTPVADPEDITFRMSHPPTHPGTILGTIGYMSPEQANGSLLDYRSDQFSFGAILYEMATGKRAFQKSSAIDTLSAILHEEPEPIEKLNEKAPAPLRWIIERCLAKSPSERYESTRDLARELKMIQERLSEASLTGPTLTRRRPLSRRTRAALMIALAGALLITVTSVILLRLPGQRGDSTPSISATSESRSIAVLPFRDLSGAAEGQLLADGLAETISARLSSESNLQVMRLPLGTAPVDLASVRRESGAALMLQGAVQRSGEEVLITWSLLDVASGAQIAGEAVRGTLAELFPLQDRLAEGVLRALNLRADPGRPTRSGLQGAAAHDRYLQAIGYLQHYENQASVDGAVRILEELAGQQSSALVQAGLGRAYLYKFRLTRDRQWADRAAEACRRAAALDPDLTEVHVTLGELLMQTGRTEEAISELQRAVAQQPSQAEAILSLAEAYRTAGKDDLAERTYERAIRLRPAYWAGYNKQGVFNLTRGRYDAAIESFEQVTRLAPDNIRGHSNLGAAHFLRGDFDRAIASFTRSIEIQPSDTAYSNLGTSYFFLKRYDEAAEAFERAVALSAEHYLLWSNLGDAYRWSGAPREKVVSTYNRAVELARGELRLNARDTTAMGVLAVCLAKQGRFEEAERLIGRALELDPASLDLMYRAVIVANLQGDENRALDRLERAISGGYGTTEAQRDPELANLHSHPRFIQLMQNRRAAAATSTP